MNSTSFDTITDFIPTSGYFYDYCKIFETYEGCPRFQFFTAAVAMGTVLKRNVYFQRGSRDTMPTLFPNMWIILVAPQGVGRKSTVLRAGREFLLSVEDRYQPTIFASKITPEKLVNTLAGLKISKEDLPKNSGLTVDDLKTQSQGLLYSSELGTFLGKEKYAEGMFSLLTDLYDCHDEWSSAQITRGLERLFNVCLTMMAATVPTWVQDMLSVDAFKGGFFSRVLFVTMPTTWNQINPIPEAPNPKAIKQIAEYLQRFTDIQGEMQWSDGAQDVFRKWYRKMKTSDGIPPYLLAYTERKQDHILRLAMLIEITKTYDKLMLSAESMKASINILDSIEPDTAYIIARASTSPAMRFSQEILEVIKERGAISEAELLKATWRKQNKSGQFTSALLMLIKAEEVKLVMHGKMPYYSLKEEQGARLCTKK